MTDPLSISVSVLAVLSSGISVATTLNSAILRYKNAPAAILALSNELSDLLLIIQEVRDQNLTSTTATSLSTMLDRADLKLHQIDLFVKSVGVLGTAKGTRRRYEKLSWAGKNSKKAEELKQSLHDVKLNIILLLSTATMSQLQLVHRNDSIVQSVSQLNPEVNIVDPEKTNAPTERSEALIQSPKLQLSCNTMGFQVRPKRKVCHEWCCCVCHRRSKIRSPRFLDSFLGTLQLGYNGIPMITSSCNESSCWQRTASTTSVMYYFPQWLVNRAISFALINSVELTASLKIPHIIDPEAKIFKSISSGDLEGVRKLLEEREASPNDIRGDCTRRSVLQDALSFKEFDICKLLIKAGADPYIPNNREQTAMDYVHLNSLVAGRWVADLPFVRNPWTPSQLAELTEMLPNTSFMYENGFSRLHKAVFQNQPDRLREELEISTKDIDQTDAQGYTALSWAAARIDSECLDILLYYGANPNPYTGEVDTLLGGLIFQSFLDESTREKRDQCLRIAINYGKAILGQEYVNQPDKYGGTALMLACELGQLSATTLLLDSGSNINLTDPWGRTPLSLSADRREALSLLLSNPRLNRTLTRKSMKELLRSVHECSNMEALRLLIEAKLSCHGLTQRDWKMLEEIDWKPWQRALVKLPEIDALWHKLICDLKSRAGPHSISYTSDDSDEDEDFDSVDSDSSMQEGSEVADTESDDNSISGEDEFEDARSSFEAA